MRRNEALGVLAAGVAFFATASCSSIAGLKGSVHQTPSASVQAQAVDLSSLRLRPLSGPKPTTSDCPSTPVSVRTVPDIERQVRGSGPAYITVGQQSGYFNKHFVWIEPRVWGPVLIRGKQIGGEQRLLFGANLARGDVASVLTVTRQAKLVTHFYPELDMGPGDSTDEWISTHGWRGWFGYWAMPVTGCYFLQVDGADFSEVIVFPVTPGFSEGQLIFSAP